MAWQWLLSSLVRGAARDAVYRHAADAVREAVRHQSGTQEGPSAEGPRAGGARGDCDIGFVFAMGVERAGLEDRLRAGWSVTRGAGFSLRHASVEGRRLVLVDAGIGERAARQATEALISGHHPQWIVSAGFSGALRPEVRRGDIVLASSVSDSTGSVLEIDLQMDQASAPPKLHVGRLVMSPRVVCRTAEKAALAARHDALAVDMESYAVAEVCRRRATRFLAARIITDALDDELPPEVNRFAAPMSTARKLGHALGAVWERPGCVKDLVKLQQESLLAADALGEFLEAIARQLIPRPADPGPADPASR